MYTKLKRTHSTKTWLLIGAVSLPLLLVMLFELLKLKQRFMASWVFRVMGPLEQFLGQGWAHFPFSAAEIITALFLIGNVAGVLWGGALAIRQKSLRPFCRRIFILMVLWLWLWAGLCWLWNAAYYVPSFAEREGVDTSPYSVEELAAVTEYFARQAAALAPQMSRDEDGHFREDLAGCFERGPQVYQAVAAQFPSLDIKSTRAKPLLCSKLQSILGFTGIYFPFTGEANVNVDAPACLVPATIAHEMSHQRMVSSELEANFVGIAACTSCDDIVFQYSGYLMGLIQLCNALYSVSPGDWYEIAGRTFSPELLVDWKDNHDYWAALESPVEDAAEKIYDSFLKSNDQELGIRSYGACVDLLVHYFGEDL